ncbi:MAG: acylphosphatase [Desulfobulbaceae bacterium]|nr:MAG: acylphosphatase [Desulfobulbaceae bacterium]
MKRCVRAVVSGKVQGVFFRAFTQEEAQRLGLEGWVRNLADGQVETLFCGPADKVEAMLAWLTEGSPQSRVDHLDYKEVNEPPGNRGFDIRY